MKKFTNLFENNSNNNVYHEIGIEKDDIVNICYDMTDSGWELKISEKYLSTSGRTYDSKKSVSTYYPLLEIKLERDKSKSRKDNIKYWNGGIYLEDDISDLKLVYLTIERISNIVKRLKKVDMNFAISGGLDNIMIRIILDLEESDSILPTENVENYLRIYYNTLLNDDKYKVDSWGGGGNSVYIDIQLRSEYLNYDNFKKIIKENKNLDAPLERKYSNILDFPKIINNSLTQINNLKTTNKELKVDKCAKNEFYPEKTYNITYNGEIIFKLKATIEPLKKVKVMTENRFFKKKYENFYIYSLYLDFIYK